MAPQERRAGEPSKEPEKPFVAAAKFEAESPAASVYFKAQETVFRNDCDLSVYRFKLREVSHVAILGESPAPELQAQLADLLAAGTAVQLPNDIVSALLQRRTQAKRVGPWVEGHYRPGRPMEH